jgi:hypothetical protein
MHEKFGMKYYPIIPFTIKGNPELPPSLYGRQ